MPKAYPLRHVIRVLESEGFFFVSQKGSHAKYKHLTNPVLTVIIPMHGKEIQYGTFRSILRQARLKESYFQKEEK